MHRRICWGLLPGPTGQGLSRCPHCWPRRPGTASDGPQGALPGAAARLVPPRHDATETEHVPARGQPRSPWPLSSRHLPDAECSSCCCSAVRGTATLASSHSSSSGCHRSSEVLGTQVMLCNHLTHDPAGLPGRGHVLHSRRTERPSSRSNAHRDTVTEPTAHVVFHLMLAQRVNRAVSVVPIMKRYRVTRRVVACHGATLTVLGAAPRTHDPPSHPRSAQRNSAPPPNQSPARCDQPTQTLPAEPRDYYYA